MEISEALNKRKSIRSYTGELPTQEQLDAVLAAAYEAPIGMGKYDSIHLTIVTNQELLTRFDSTAAANFGMPDGHPLYGAPMLIVISSNQQGNVASANVSAIIENMSLACVAEDLGSCFIFGAISTLANDPQFLKEFGIPEGFTPLGAIILGKTDEAYEEREIPEAHRFAQNVVD